MFCQCQTSTFFCAKGSGANHAPGVKVGAGGSADPTVTDAAERVAKYSKTWEVQKRNLFTTEVPLFRLSRDSRSHHMPVRSISLKKSKNTRYRRDEFRIPFLP